MARQFKFRIWHKKEKRWLDPWAEEDPILSLKDFGRGCEVYLYDRKTKDHSNINCQMDDVIIQQYTGVKDKNGVEIYEGDLIRTLKSYMYPEVIAEIAWDNGWYADNKKLLVHWRMSVDFTSSVEIVGNIFKGVKNETI